MNYEVEIRNSIFNELKNRFNINDSDELYKYLLLRNECINNTKFPTKEELGVNIEFMRFLLDELYIDDYFYMGEKIVFQDTLDNSMSEIVKTMRFRYSFKKIENEDNVSIGFYNKIKATWDLINNKAKRKIKKLNTPFKSKYLIYFRLEELNNIFEIKDIKNSREIKGFNYGEKFYGQLSLELQLERYIRATKENTSDLYHISEEDFEKYVYSNLDKIEKGLKPIQRQYEVEDGIIDILARDKEERLTMIELKICTDKHLLWQVMYYPDALKDKMKVKDVRIITVCPSYPKYILEPLKKVENVEMIAYSPIIEKGVVKSIECREVV